MNQISWEQVSSTQNLKGLGGVSSSIPLFIALGLISIPIIITLFDGFQLSNERARKGPLADRLTEEELNEMYGWENK